MDAELERILVEDYLDGLAAIGAAELRSRRGECQVVETQLSYLRRLVQGRHDIVTSEIDHRRGGGEPGDVTDLVDRLPVILADRLHAPGRAGYPPAWSRASCAVASSIASMRSPTPWSLARRFDAAADVLARAADELADLELEDLLAPTVPLRPYRHHPGRAHPPLPGRRDHRRRPPAALIRAASAGRRPATAARGSRVEWEREF